MAGQMARPCRSTSPGLSSRQSWPDRPCGPGGRGPCPCRRSPNCRPCRFRPACARSARPFAAQPGLLPPLPPAPSHGGPCRRLGASDRGHGLPRQLIPDLGADAGRALCEDRGAKNDPHGQEHKIAGHENRCAQIEPVDGQADQGMAPAQGEPRLYPIRAVSSATRRMTGAIKVFVDFVAALLKSGPHLRLR